MNSSTLPSDLYCVMGNPVEHSRSPWIHARFAELTSQRLVYERRLVPLDGFAQALRDFAAGGGRGCNITVPFKLEAAQAATVRSERVQLAGAANTLSFIDGAIHADNTDGLGLVADIEQGHISSASCILANHAMNLERTLHWDSAAGEVRGDDEANALLAWYDTHARAMPWRTPPHSPNRPNSCFEWAPFIMNCHQHPLKTEY